jgi:tripartite-type tricarboxylate transporter receptor subunit TctC
MLSFNFIRDTAPVASVIRTPGVMEVNPLFLAKTVPEFMAYAKANPGKINMATSGAGSSPYIYGEAIQDAGRRKFGSGSLSRFRTCIDRSHRRAS